MSASFIALPNIISVPPVIPGSTIFPQHAPGDKETLAIIQNEPEPTVVSGFEAECDRILDKAEKEYVDELLNPLFRVSREDRLDKNIHIDFSIFSEWVQPEKLHPFLSVCRAWH